MDGNSFVGFPERKKNKDAVSYATVYAEATNLLPPLPSPGLPDPNPGPQLPIDTEVRFESLDSTPVVGRVKSCIHYTEEKKSENILKEERRKVSCISDIVAGHIFDKDDQYKAEDKAIFTISPVNDRFQDLFKEPGDVEETGKKKGDGHGVGLTSDSDEKSGNIKEEEQVVCCDQRFTTIEENDDSESGNKEKEREGA